MREKTTENIKIPFVNLARLEIHIQVNWPLIVSNLLAHPLVNIEFKYLRIYSL